MNYKIDGLTLKMENNIKIEFDNYEKLKSFLIDILKMQGLSY